MTALVDPHAGLRELRAVYREIVKTYGKRSSHAQRAFEELFRESIHLGRPLDQLRRHSPDEVERFFTRTVSGPDGHIYWSGGRDFQTNDRKGMLPRRWWWQHKHGVRLDPFTDLVPVCGDANCINPEHHRSGRSERRRWFSDEQIIGTFQVAASRLGKTPSARLWDELSLQPHSTSIYKRFGTWAKACAAAGLPEPVRGGEETRYQPNTRTECVEAIQLAVRLLGHRPTIEEFHGLGAQLKSANLPTNRKTIEKYLGSNWRGSVKIALEEAA